MVENQPVGEPRQHGTGGPFFLVFTASQCLFSDLRGGVDIRLVLFFRNLGEVDSWDWRGAAYAYLLWTINLLSFGNRGLKGAGFILQPWCFEHLGIIAPRMRDPQAFFFPIATRWGDNQVLRARCHPPGTTAHSLLNDLTEVTWRPFQCLIFPHFERVVLARHLSENRVLFWGI
ncbi:uncharacterized protein LOC122083853 [Macadamia integrifolia]|uniref:uncharacterized protein LOC122083853 n=1 Tax=Macadamia integrifolia TaxID=60698 RepID=UPI001C4F0727|nr:uncharacterized protein LOC122083853 [Macadamia integrifolia]